MVSRLSLKAVDAKEPFASLRWGRVSERTWLVKKDRTQAIIRMGRSDKLKNFPDPDQAVPITLQKLVPFSTFWFISSL